MLDYQDENNMTMITMNIHTVPQWLRNSEMYRNLSEGEDEFSFPSCYIKQNSNIYWIDDFKDVIQSIIFWGVDEIPHSIFDFVIHKYSEGYFAVKDLFPDHKIWHKLDIFVDYIEKLRLTMDMVNLTASSRLMWHLVVKFANLGYIDCVKFCLSLFNDSEKDYLLNSNIYLGIIVGKMEPHKKIETMENLKSIGFPLIHTSSSINKYTEENPECFLWLHKNGAPFDISTLKQAISEECVNTIRYILQNGIPLSEEIMEYACYQDNERAVEFFINLACPCDHNSFLRAVENHNLEIVRRLQDYGCPWDVEVIVKAVDFGNLEFLEYLHRNGCPWNRDAFDILELRREVPRLFTRDHELCYQYLIENGCPQE